MKSAEANVHLKEETQVDISGRSNQHQIRLNHTAALHCWHRH